MHLYNLAYKKKEGTTMKKNEFRKELEEKILQTLEDSADTLEWIKEWAGQTRTPYNGATKIRYKGLNIMNLTLTARIKGYKDPRWYTMNQIKDLKGIYHKNQKWHLKAGTKGSWVEYWAPYDVINHKTVTWEEYNEILKKNPDAQFTLFTKYACVFNADCIEGVPELVWKPVNENVKPSEVVDTIASGMGVPIFNDGGDRAYYSVVRDEVHLPLPTAFNNELSYNLTALHELCHATGNSKRLDRNIGNPFGSDSYAMEELIAEIAAAFSSWHLSEEINDDALRNSQAYVQSWGREIKKNPSVVIKAVQEAQKAADYIDQILMKEE